MASKWTFMVYMAGFNNLSEFAGKDVDEMRTAGSTDDVKMAVFLKQLGDKAANYLLVGKDGQGEVRERVGEVDSGSPQTLLDFVRWAVKTAPADKYALVVWNHGSGWQPDDLDDLYEQVRMRGGGGGVTPRELGVRSTAQVARTLFSTSVQQVLSLPTAGDRGIASDDGSGHSLDTIELNRVLEKAHAEMGKPLELLGMDACLMSALEVAYEVQEHAKVVVGSEELEPGDGWPYHKILPELVSNPDMDGAALGRAIVQHYIESYRHSRDQWPVTQCAIDTAGITAFVEALDQLASALSDHVGDEVQSARVMRAQARSPRFTGELVDLKAFCDNLTSIDIAPAIQEGAAGVSASLAPGDFVLEEGHLGPTVKGCGGVTAYFPPPSDSISKFYADLKFAKDHQWDDFLGSYQRGLRGE